MLSGDNQSKSRFLDQNILEASGYIRKTYQDYGIPIPASSWLWQNLDTAEHIGKRHKLSVPPEQYQEMSLFILGASANIQMFAGNLRVCLEKGKDLKSKLEDVIPMKYANSKIHEIHNLACLLRSGFDADFIEEQGTKTPDILVIGKGVLECKTVHSEKAIARELVEASRKMRHFEGEKVTDFYLYLFDKPLTEDYLNQLWRQSVLSAKKDLERIRAFNGFSFSYSKLANGPNGEIGLELKSHRWIVEGSQAGLEILRALQNTL
jgi:hypothetical protein